MQSRPLKIYTSSDVPRLKYIAEVILGEILGLSYEIITDKRKLGNYNTINYSSESIDKAFKILPQSLLFEVGVKPQDIVVEKWEDLPVFFTTTENSDLPFDIFASSFYLISRYEEYLDFQADEHGRFPAYNSLAYKNGFLDIPIIDKWVREFAKVLVRKFHTLTFKSHRFNALLTIDIDQPFAYRGKGVFRSIGGVFRDISNNSGNLADRYRILSSKEKDPYEVFDYIIDTVEEHGVEAKFFIPVGDHSDYDKNPSWKNDDFRKLIHKISEKFNIGLHPSYVAAKNSAKLNIEVQRLKLILDKDIVSSRFHFIRFFLPHSFRAIYAAGVSEDYSMGYPDEPGFRAGIARPFYFYDILSESRTDLRIVPFQIMDVTLYNYKKLDPATALKLIHSIIEETRKVGGQFVSIWHNTSLLDDDDWKTWRDVFEDTLKTQIS